MNYRDEMELYERYAAQDPVEELQREEEEEYRRYIRERKRRIARRRRREKMLRQRIRRIRLTAAGIILAVIALIVIVRIAVGDPVRDSLTIELGSPLPEARAFLKREKSRAAVYFVTDMTQVDTNIAGETPIVVEINGKQYESRLIVVDPDAADGTGDNSVEEADAAGTDSARETESTGTDVNAAGTNAADGTDVNAAGTDALNGANATGTDVLGGTDTAGTNAADGTDVNAAGTDALDGTNPAGTESGQDEPVPLRP